MPGCETHGGRSHFFHAGKKMHLSEPDDKMVGMLACLDARGGGLFQAGQPRTCA